MDVDWLNDICYDVQLYSLRLFVLLQLLLTGFAEQVQLQPSGVIDIGKDGWISR